jgi:hypothetical protein
MWGVDDLERMRIQRASPEDGKVVATASICAEKEETS